MEAITKEKKFITRLFLLSVILFFWLIKGYIGVLIFSLITAFFASGLFKKIKQKTKKTRIALTGTWVVIALTVIAPVVLIATTTIQQVGIFAGDVEQVISENQESVDSNINREHIDSLIAKADEYNKKYNINIDIESLYQKGFEAVRTVATNITTWIYSFAMNLFGRFTALFLYCFVTSGILLHQDELLESFKKILPLDQRKTNAYLTKIAAMMNAIIKGTFVIASIQGLITGISFLIGGVPYFAFWTLLVAFLSLIPMVGAGIIAFPVGIVLLLTGSVRQGIMILVVNLLIVGNVDTLLRPKLVKGDAKINGALLILSIFGGMAIFGFMGMFYGPVIMVFVLTSIHYYLEQVK